jgi:ubiquinone/menaquinone biosynthesis C-methylase UbiE
VDAKLQRRIQRYGWDKAAGHYERFWREQLEPAQRLLLEMADLQPGERVLDIACGTGLITLPAARAVGSTGHVLGTDISDSMVSAARSAAVSAHATNTSFARMDAEHLDLSDDSFDAALCALGLMYVPDPVQALREMRRVLKPGGRAVAAVWGARNKCGWADIFPIVDARVESEVCPLFFQLGTGNALGFVMQQAGFEQVNTERINTTLHYDSADEAIGAAFAGGPVALAYSRFDDETRAAAHAEYLTSIAAFEHDGSYRIPGEFVVARARKTGVPHV